MILRRGSQGDAVVMLQVALGVEPADGIFGPKTEAAVEEYQEGKNLYADGKVGPLTWSALAEDGAVLPAQEPEEEIVDAVIGGSKMQLVRVELGAGVPGGYERLRLREDAANAFSKVMLLLKDFGAHATTSGGTRGLRAKVSANRSATSLHYLGAAVDLWVGGGISNPRRDPYIVERGEGRYWRVWARCADGSGESRTLDAVRAGNVPLRVQANVISLTALMEGHGFAPIRSRPSSWNNIASDRKYHSGCEWWHFSFVAGLQKGTTFGSELMRIYPMEKVVGTPPWRYKDYVFNGSSFQK